MNFCSQCFVKNHFINKWLKTHAGDSTALHSISGLTWLFPITILSEGLMEGNQNPPHAGLLRCTLSARDGSCRRVLCCVQPKELFTVDCWEAEWRGSHCLTFSLWAFKAAVINRTFPKFLCSYKDSFNLLSFFCISSDYAFTRKMHLF